MNRLIGWSDTEYVFFMNPDCRLTERSLPLLVSWLNEHPDDAAAAPLLLGDDGKPQRQFQLRRLPTPFSVARDLLLLDELMPRSRAARSHRYAELTLTEPAVIEQPAAAAMLVRRSVLEELGGFDEQFFPAWFEDVDLCRRMKERGMTIRLIPDSEVHHTGSSSLGALGYGRFLEISHRNLALYSAKWFRPGARELVRLCAIFGMLLRLAAVPLPRSLPVKRGEAVRMFARVLRGWFLRWPHSTSSW